MRRILVVDDEAIQRRVLGKIIRKAMPASEVLEAANGKIALDLVRDTEIDIIFTDIRMQVMDGLTFVEQLQQLRKGIKIVILTGYRYFEYAQKALQLGAADFLLKPVREDTIVETLGKLEASLGQDRETLEQIHQYYEQSLHEWIVYGRDAKRQEIVKHYALRSSGVVLIAETVPGGSPAENERGRERRRQSVTRSLAELLQPADGVAVSFPSRENGAHIVALVTCEAGAFDEDGLRSAAARLNDEWGGEAAVCIGVGTERPLERSIHESCQEALQASSRRFFYPREAVLVYRELRDRLGELTYDFAKDEALMKDAVRRTRDDELRELAAAMFANALGDRLPPVESWKNALARVLLNVSGLLKDFMPESEYAKMRMQLEDRLRGSRDNEEALDRFAEALRQFADFLRQLRSKKHESVIERLIGFIDERYMDDLSLESVAKQLYFSPNYLSAMIKTHIGMTFSKYLSDVRIRQAVELLRGSELKVYEIAARVGFRDEKYFYRVFKGQFAVTPDEYRREMGWTK